MDRIARAPQEERAELFRRSATVLRPVRSPAIIEKDFWGCWTLRRIYDVLQFHPRMIFKGGTSLSKVYDAIERFSEDLDLSLSRRDLGFVDNRDPEETGISKNESKRRIEALVSTCQQVILDRLLPALRVDFASVIGGLDWSLELDATDPQTVIFTYPRSNTESKLPGYIRPAIRIEMGARSDDWPGEYHEVRPYAAEAFPQAFKLTTSCRVYVLDAERTFWEKATLLHAEFHRPTDKPMADGMSRHYYDLYQLSQHNIGRQALNRRDLLDRVIVHKQLFFTSAWAHYETATAGNFHLVPPEKRIPLIRADYVRMREMIFGEAPTWEQIVKGLRELEDRINGM